MIRFFTKKEKIKKTYKPRIRAKEVFIPLTLEHADGKIEKELNDLLIQYTKPEGVNINFNVYKSILENNVTVSTSINLYTDYITVCESVAVFNGVAINNIFTKDIFKLIFTNMMMYSNCVICYSFSKSVDESILAEDVNDNVNMEDVNIETPPEVAALGSLVKIDILDISSIELDIEADTIKSNEDKFIFKDVVFNKDLSTGLYIGKAKSWTGVISIMSDDVFITRKKLEFVRPKLVSVLPIYNWVVTYFRQNMAYLHNNTNLSGILEYPLNASEDALKKVSQNINEIFNSSVANAGRMAVVAPGSKYTPMNKHNSDPNYINLDNYYEERIFKFFRIPLPMILSKSLARDNYSDSLSFFVNNAFKSVITDIISKVMYSLPGIYFDLDLTTIPSFSNIKDEGVMRKKETGIYTINELREMEGLPPIAGADVLPEQIKTKNDTTKTPTI